MENFIKKILFPCVCLAVIVAPFSVYALGSPSPDMPFLKTISNITNFLFVTVVVLSILAITIAAFLIVVGHGDPDKTSIAKSIILWSVVAMVLMLMSKAIVMALVGIIA
jgi:hypothetical protein